MKRTIRITALLLALVTVFTLPASADDFDNDSWMNVLDYAMPNDAAGTTVKLTSDSPTVTFDLPGMRTVFDIDMVVAINTGTLTAVATPYGSLTVLFLGSNTYRVYGRYCSGYKVDKLSLTFTMSTYTYVDFLSVNVSSLSAEHYADIGTMSFSYAGGTAASYTMSSSSSLVSTSTFGSANFYYNYNLTLFTTNWRKYDYIDFLVDMRVNSIDSIYAEFDGVYLPIEVSGYDMSAIDGYTYYSKFTYSYDGTSEAEFDYVSDSIGYYNSEDGYLDFEEEVEGSVAGSITETGDGTITGSFHIVDVNNIAYVMVRVDLRGLKRTSSSYPTVHIDGTCRMVAGGNLITLESCNGYIETDTPDPVLLYMRTMNANLVAWHASLQESVDTFQAALIEKLTYVEVGITSELSLFQKNLRSDLDQMHDTLGAIWEEVYDGFRDIRSTMVSQYNGMITFLTDTLPVRIAEEIAKVFVPSEGKIEQTQQEAQELAQERLGAVYQSTQIIDSLSGAFQYQSTQGTVAFPAVTIDLAGVPFTFGGWDVQVVPDGFGGIVEVLKFLLDIVCTLGFAQALKGRLEKMMEA